MDLQKILKIVAANIGVLSIGFLAWIISAGDDAIKAGESASSVSTYMYVAYFVLAVAVLSVVVFTVLNLIHNAAGLKNTLISIAAFILLALICYFVFASGVETILKDGSVLTVVQSKLVGAGLYLFYILALVAGLTMLFFSTTNQASLSEKVVNIVVKTIPALCVLIVFAFFGVGEDGSDVQYIDPCKCARNAILVQKPQFSQKIQDKCANFSKYLTEDEKKERLEEIMRDCPETLNVFK